MLELHEAIMTQQLDRVKVLLSRGADVEARDKTGWTSLHWAASTSDNIGVKMVRQLLHYNVDVNAKTNCGQTSMHFACRTGYVKIATLLIAFGATTDDVTQCEDTCLDLAKLYDYQDIVQLLSGKDDKELAYVPDQIDHEDMIQSILVQICDAMNMREYPLVEKLLDSSLLEINTVIRDRNNTMILQHAIDHDNSNTITRTLTGLVLMKGADPNVEVLYDSFTTFLTKEAHFYLCPHNTVSFSGRCCRKRSNITTQSGKKIYGHSTIIRGSVIHCVRSMSGMTALVRYGADVNMPNKAGWSPLHTYCHRGNIKMVLFLIGAGAIVPTSNDLTPLALAAAQNHFKVCKLLLEYGANPIRGTEYAQGCTPLELTTCKTIKKLFRDHSEFECTICMEDVEMRKTVSTFTCIHRFCKSCIEEWIKTNPTCPLCRKPLQMS